MPRGAVRDPLIRGDAAWPSTVSQAVAGDAPGRRLWLGDQGAAVALAAGVGRRTRWLRLGLVVQPHRRALTVLAKQLTGLDVLLAGRLDVALDQNTGEAEAAEVTEALRELFSGRPVSRGGPLVLSDGARCLPPARQQPLPIYRVTGSGADWVEVGQPA
ncbi:MAG: hypothetical protein ACYCTI_04850 [Acidimicrobiales bacterium]